MLEHGNMFCENLTVKIEGFFQTCQHNYKKQFLLLACCCGKFHCFFERDFLLTSCRLQTLFDTGLKHTTTDLSNGTNIKCSLLSEATTSTEGTSPQYHHCP